MDIHQLGWKQFHEHKRTGLFRRRFLWFWGDVWLEVRRPTRRAADAQPGEVSFYGSNARGSYKGEL